MISQRMLLGIGILLFLAACQPAKPSPTATTIPSPTATPTTVPTATPTPEPTAPDGLYPPNSRTGIPEIDVVLEAVAHGNFDVLKNLVDPTEVPCQTQHYDLPGGPRCPEGVQEGTPVEAFPRGSCGGGDWAPIEDTPYFFNYLQAERSPLYVYAVYRSQRSIEGIRPVAYEIVLANTIYEEEPVDLFLDAEGLIIRFDFECSLQRENVEEIDFVLPSLPVPPTPTPTPVPILEHGAPEGFYSPDARTGIPEVDVVLEAVANQDIDTLKSLIGLPFLSGSCEAGYTTDLKSVKQFFDYYAVEFPQYVYAVYQPEFYGEDDTTIAFEIVLASSLADYAADVFYLDSEGRIIGSTHCQYAQFSLPGDADFILPPNTTLTANNNLTSYISNESYALGTQLSRALGVPPLCDFDCVDDEAFVQIVENLLDYCRDFEPESFYGLPGFDPESELHGERVRAIAQACELMLSARTTLGEVQKNDDWGRVVFRAIATLYQEPFLHGQQVEELLVDEADGMLYGLRIAAGENVPCADPCTFVNLVQGLIENCQDLDLAYWRLLLGIDGPMRSQVLDALQQACGILVSAQDSLGEPQENEEWIAVVLEAKAALEEIVQE